MRYRVTRTWLVKADNGLDAINKTKDTNHMIVQAIPVTLRTWQELGGSADEYAESPETSPERDEG